MKSIFSIISALTFTYFLTQHSLGSDTDNSKSWNNENKLNQNQNDTIFKEPDINKPFGLKTGASPERKKPFGLTIDTSPERKKPFGLKIDVSPNIKKPFGLTLDVGPDVFNSAAHDKMLLRQDPAARGKALDYMDATYHTGDLSLLAKEAQSVKFPEVHSLNKSLLNLTEEDVKNFLVQLNKLPLSKDRYSVVKVLKPSGHFTVSLFKIYVNTTEDPSTTSRRLLYVVKFHSNTRTPIEAIWNQQGVKIHSTLRTQNTFKYPFLPRLAFDETTARVSLNDNPYYFTIFHAAQGELAEDSFKAYGEANEAQKISLKPKITNMIKAIARSMGTFHAYHALENPYLKWDLINEFKMSLADNQHFFVFQTIIHNDLHPGNIVINLSKNPQITLIDLESMFNSAVMPSSNENDLKKFTFKSAQLLRTREFNSVFLQAYSEAIKATVIEHAQVRVASEKFRAPLQSQDAISNHLPR